MKPHEEQAARWVINATAWVSKFTKHQRQEVSLPSLAKELPLKVVWVSCSAAKGGGENQHPQNNPRTVHPGRGAVLPRVTTAVSTAMVAPRPCPIHRATSLPCPLLSSILGLMGAPVPQSGPGRADLGTGQSRLCCPITAWANSQLLALAKTLIFFPLSLHGSSDTVMAAGGGKKTNTPFQAGEKTMAKVGLERIKETQVSRQCPEDGWGAVTQPARASDQGWRIKL